jgi:hypothetical protein
MRITRHISRRQWLWRSVSRQQLCNLLLALPFHLSHCVHGHQHGCGHRGGVIWRKLQISFWEPLFRGQHCQDCCYLYHHKSGPRHIAAEHQVRTQLLLLRNCFAVMA